MLIKAVTLAFIVAQSVPAHASEQAALDASVEFSSDIVHVVGDDVHDRTFYLDNLSLTLDADLDQLLGWAGATAHFNLQNNAGGMPNAPAGTLQGLNNIEVGRQALRVFELWLQQDLDARSTVRVGLYDLNSEFYATEPAGLFLNPAFGIGTELAATGSGGPSIFPSTALAVRVDRKLDDRVVARLAVLNATARTVGDPGGIDVSFDEGVLMVAELALVGRTAASVGVWGYSRSQDDIHAVDSDGEPLRRKARGIYVMADHSLTDPDAPFAMRAFARLGFSDGRTTPFRGGWQAGVAISRPLAARPDGTLSIGASQAWLAGGFRATLADDGIDSVAAETVFEVTYADQLAGWLTIQPDVQLVLNPGGERHRRPVIVPGVRIAVAF